MRLDGKAVFVTGAGGGIGRAICERFLEEGAQVGATDLDLDAAKAAVSGASVSDRALALRCDAGESDSVREAIAATVAAFGGLNVLCNVAGGSSSRDGRVTEAAEEEFWRVIRIDLFGTVLACKHGLPELIKAGGGSVINMTSMAAQMSIDRDFYSAAKGGVVSLTRSLAAGYARDGIRVNAIAPGITVTPRVKAALDAGEVAEGLAGRHLLGVVEPIDIAHLAVYLAADESRTVTGQVFAVDSGVTIH